MILDLDLLVPAKKQVKIGGKQYDLEAGVPTALMMAFQREMQVDPTSAETLQSVGDILTFAFKSYENAKEVVGGLNMEQTLAIINYLFGVEVGTDGKNG